MAELSVVCEGRKVFRSIVVEKPNELPDDSLFATEKNCGEGCGIRNANRLIVVKNRRIVRCSHFGQPGRP